MGPGVEQFGARTRRDPRAEMGTMEPTGRNLANSVRHFDADHSIQYVVACPWRHVLRLLSREIFPVSRYFTGKRAFLSVPAAWPAT